MESAAGVPLVSYVVITRNRRDQLEACLANLGEQDWPRRQLVVVDNGSTDGSPAMVRERFPDAVLVELAENQGVAGGRNRGVERAEGELCVLIDDDARLRDRAATRHVVALFQAEPRRALLAFRIVSAHTGEEEWKSIPRTDKRVIETDYPCAYFPGAGFALRRAVFLELGGFWERLVYSCEELDLSYRLIERGHGLLRASGVVVDHHEVPAARPPAQWVYFNARNRCWVAARNLPWRHVACTCVVWWTRLLAVAARRGQLGAFARGVSDALGGLPAVLRERRPVGRATRRAVRMLGGRLWY
jgi:GT2 family glycosyltransferase